MFWALRFEIQFEVGEGEGMVALWRSLLSTWDFLRIDTKNLFQALLAKSNIEFPFNLTILVTCITRVHACGVQRGLPVARKLGHSKLFHTFFSINGDRDSNLKLISTCAIWNTVTLRVISIRGIWNSVRV